MPPTVVIEIAPAVETDLPIELITAAYRASRWAHVVFIMPADMRPLVDRALDPLVAEWGLSACGVRYCIAPDAAVLGPVLTRASWAMIESPGLQAICGALGVTRVDAPAALARLLHTTPMRGPGAVAPAQRPIEATV